MRPEEPFSASRKRVDAMRALSPSDFSVWAHFEERADRLGERLWSVGAWLIALVGTTLSLPFVADLIKALPVYPYLRLENRVAVAVLALFGILLCLYAYHALRDVREHIESNWRRAGYVLDGTWQSEWKGRKSHGWAVLLVIGSLAALTFISLLLLAVSGAG